MSASSAFRLGLDFPVREDEYTEADAAAGIDALFPALELGDTVFLDWYGASAYFGSCLDNGGGAALIRGTEVANWQDVDLVTSGMDLYLNGWYIKSGQGKAAMGHPVTSLTWMINWAARARPANTGRRGSQHRDMHRALFCQRRVMWPAPISGRWDAWR